MSSNSLWLKESSSRFEALSGERSADVAVIGGGIAGLSAAYYLAKAGKKVTVIEAGLIGAATSGHTTAHITSQHDMTYARYIRRFGWEKAGLVASANQEAIASIAAIVQSENIACGFGFEDSYLFTAENGKVAALEREAVAAALLGIPSGMAAPDFILPYKAALRFSGQAAFHPVLYMNGLANAIVKYGGELFENSRVLHLRDGVAYTEGGSVRANAFVIATHNPVINFPGAYFARMYQHRSYAAAFENAPSVSGLFVSIDKDGHTYRNFDKYLIVCGGDHKCGTQCSVNHYKHLELSVLSSFPDANPVFQWSAQDGITLDNLPYIGCYSKKLPNVYVVTGFGKWGVTQSHVAAKILSDEILGAKNKYAEVFSPQRPLVPSALLSGIVQNAATAGNLAVGLFRFGAPKCAHMKCGLVQNRDDESFDCPCHGSRFDQDGKVLDTPAIHSLKPRRRS